MYGIDKLKKAGIEITEGKVKKSDVPKITKIVASRNEEEEKLCQRIKNSSDEELNKFMKEAVPSEWTYYGSMGEDDPIEAFWMRSTDDSIEIVTTDIYGGGDEEYWLAQETYVDADVLRDICESVVPFGDSTGNGQYDADKDEDFAQMINNIAFSIPWHGGYNETINNEKIESEEDVYELWKDVCDRFDIPCKIDEAESKMEASSDRFEYDFKKMIRKDNQTNKTQPMRLDQQGGMVDVWSEEANEWIWNDEATDALKNHLGSMTTGGKDNRHIILDWAGNEMLGGETFDSFEEADEALNEMVDGIMANEYPDYKDSQDKYEKEFYEEKDEFQIIPLEDAHLLVHPDELSEGKKACSNTVSKEDQILIDSLVLEADEKELNEEDAKQFVLDGLRAKGIEREEYDEGVLELAVEQTMHELASGTEATASTRYDQLEHLEQYMNTMSILEALTKAMSDDEFNENYQYIARMNDFEDKVEIEDAGDRNEQMDHLVEMLGEEDALMSLVMAMGDHQFNENYEYIVEVYGIHAE